MIGLARIGGKGTPADPYAPENARDVPGWTMIDLRPGGVGPGECIVGGPELPKGAVVLGDEPKGRSKATTNILRNRLSVNLEDQPLGREVLALLLEHGRTDGNGWRPLLPNKRKKRYEVWLGGELIEAMPLTRGGQVITDDFNRASLGADWVVAGSQSIISNGLVSSGTGVAIHQTPLDSSDMRVTLENTTLWTSPPAVGPMARIDLPTSSDAYWAYWRLDVPRMQLMRLAGDLLTTPTVTALTSFTGFGGSAAVAIQCIGSTIEALDVNGPIQIQVVTDTVIPGNFGHGVRSFQVGATHTDSYRAETFDSAWSVGFVGAN